MTTANVRTTSQATSGYAAFVTSAAFSTTGGTSSAFYVTVLHNNAVAMTVTDTAGNTYVPVGTQLANGYGGYLDRFYVLNPTGGGSFQYTVTAASGTPSYTTFFYELGNVSGFDQTNNGKGYVSSPYTTGAVTLAPPASGELAITTLQDGQFTSTAITFACSGFTIAQQQTSGNSQFTSGASAYQLVTTAGSYSASWTDGYGATSYIGVIDTFMGVANAPALGTLVNTGAGATTLPAGANILNANFALLYGLTGSQVVAFSTFSGADPTGGTDCRAVLATAMASVAGTNKFLYIDGTFKLTFGYNVNNTIFVASGTNLIFAPGGAGKFVIDNSLIPAFCWVNATNCTWINDTYEYVGSTPLNYAAAPYNGQIVNNFTTGPLNSYMIANCGNTFTGTNAYLGGFSQGFVHLITGACSNLNFYNSTAYVPTGANASTFLYGFANSQYQWVAGLAVTNTTPQNSTYLACPNDINWYNATLDGYYFGWAGAGRTGMNVRGLTAKRYSILQDSSGNNLGGTGFWVGPAHLFYMDNTVSGFDTNSTTIADVTDYGFYVGGATRPSTGSWGQMFSLKLEMGPNVTVSNYRSSRPDGVAQILSLLTDAQNATITNIGGTFDSRVATSDSSILYGFGFNSGAVGFHNVAVRGLVLTDLNPSPTQFPIQLPQVQATNNFELKNASIYLNDWGGTNHPTFVNAGGDSLDIELDIYFNTYSSLTTHLGFLVMQGSTTTTNSTYRIRAFGFRSWNVTFTAAIAAGATSATLATVNSGTTNAVTTWPGTTGQYTVKFPTGEIHWVTFTNGATTATWANQMISAQSAGAICAVTGIVASNYAANKPQSLAFQAGNGYGNRAIVEDVTNGYTATIINGRLREERTQLFSCTPIGATYTTPLTLLATESVIDTSAFVVTALDTGNGLTSFQMGTTTSPALFLTGCPITTVSSQVNPVASPISLGGSASTVMLMGTGGTGFGTSVGTQAQNLMISITSAQVSGCR